jgi:hypothetical protein
MEGLWVIEHVLFKDYNNNISKVNKSGIKYLSVVGIMLISKQQQHKLIVIKCCWLLE